MAWIYLAESEESHLPWKNGSGRLPIVKTIDTPSQFYCHVCQMDNCPAHPFGTTFAPFMDNSIYPGPSTSFMEDSPARTLVLRAMESAWAVSEADFSSTSSGLSKKQTQNLYFSKTSQQLELVASTVSHKHLPISGMISGGRLFQPKKLAPATFAKDGSDLPTPTAQSYGSNQGGAAGRAGKRRDSINSMASRGLIPSPMARDWKGSGGANRKSPDLPLTMGGALNPPFVEEIMGYPIGHTELEDWAMQWYQPRRERLL